ncbi:hypothetical protein NDI44_02420 [Trichocoleus sp. DQ-A3]|uniref:hypothetical protein n=1 Tax=Cyanophyceae TaxID=3028117 RepID=UPI001685DAC5|nr:hypothetical protein [Coleofasciculus sp. FACHB-125]MBD1901712.1 hypothetical protein [Coleofasciculus sp. FACHB-125]
MNFVSQPAADQKALAYFSFKPEVNFPAFYVLRSLHRHFIEALRSGENNRFI